MKTNDINVNRITIFILILVTIVCALSFAFALYCRVEISFYLNDELYKTVNSDKNYIEMPTVDKDENFHLIGWYKDSSFKYKIDDKKGIKTLKLLSKNIYGKYEECQYSNWILDKVGTCGVDGEKYRVCIICSKKQTEILKNSQNHNFLGNECNNCETIVFSIGLAFKELNENEVEITGRGDCFDRKLYIPDEIDGKKVVSIAVEAFKDDFTITEIKFGKNVSKIADKAFNNCGELVKVSFVNEAVIGEIANYAFENCKKLNSIFIHWTVNTIGEGAFKGCESLTFVELFKELKELGEEAFKNCYNLSQVYFSQEIKLETIKAKTFQNCKKLSQVIFPGVIKNIGDYAFSDCSSLKTFEIKATSRLTSIGQYAFYNCVSLEQIVIPKNVIELSAFVFSGCISLENLKISELSELTTINARAFENCLSLKKVVISDKVKFIEESAFYNCPAEIVKTFNKLYH